MSVVICIFTFLVYVLQIFVYCQEPVPRDVISEVLAAARRRRGKSTPAVALQPSSSSRSDNASIDRKTYKDKNSNEEKSNNIKMNTYDNMDYEYTEVDDYDMSFLSVLSDESHIERLSRTAHILR